MLTWYIIFSRVIKLAQDDLKIDVIETKVDIA